MHVTDRVSERIIRHLVRISIEWHGISRIQEKERSCNITLVAMTIIDSSASSRLD